MRNDRDDNDRNFRTNTVSATLSALAHEHIRERYHPLRHARELLARAAGVTPNAARNWLRRDCAPHADNLGELIKNDPEFREKVLAWIEAHK